MSDKVLEVTNIANDTYHFYGEHLTRIQEQINDNEADFEATEKRLNELQEELNTKNVKLKQLKVQKEALIQKKADLREIMVDLEKHKANFKQIIMPKK